MSCTVVGGQRYHQDAAGRLVEDLPQACPAGHRYRAGRVLVGWCGSHRYYGCRDCLDQGVADAYACYRTRP